MSDDLDEITKLVQPVIRVIAATVHQLEQTILRDEIAKSSNARAVRKWVKNCRPKLIQAMNEQIISAFSVVANSMETKH